VSPAEARAKEVSQAEAKYNARQKLIRVTAAKSLLKEELEKVNPCLPSVSAFRKAAYGDKSADATSGEPGDMERVGIFHRSSRKKPADDSPERESTGTNRKGFPGAVTRSEAGCRVHLPNAGKVALLSTLITAVTSATAPNGMEIETRMTPMNATGGGGMLEAAVETTRESVDDIALAPVADTPI